MIRSLRSAVACSIALAAVSTFGDFVWATWIHDHRTLFGLAHGTLLGAALGLALGLVRGRALAGALYGMLIVLLAACGFYALYSLLGYSGMFVAWMAFWMGFGVLGGRGLSPRHGVREALVRGVLAALGSGLAFYAISGIWTNFDPRTIDYPYHLLCWTIAFLPGFLALLLEQKSSS
jgi:hypothetical protein